MQKNFTLRSQLVMKKAKIDLSRIAWDSQNLKIYIWSALAYLNKAIKGNANSSLGLAFHSMLTVDDT